MVWFGCGKAAGSTAAEPLRSKGQHEHAGVEYTVVVFFLPRDKWTDEIALSKIRRCYIGVLPGRQLMR